MSFEILKLAISAAALGGDVRQAPAMSRRLGFAGLQFDAYSPAVAFPDLPASGRREVRHLLDSQGQQLVGLRVDLGPHGLGPKADIDRTLSRLDRVLETAAGLAAPLVCVDLASLPEPSKTPKKKPKVSREEAGLIILPSGPLSTEPAEPAMPAAPPPDPAVVSQVDGALAELGRLADRYSTMVAFRSDLASFAALDRAVRSAACPWFGLDLDPASVLRDEWDLDEIFSRLGSLIRHVRARDAVAGTDHRTQPAIVGRGSVDWPTLLSHLDEADYRGWITLDPIDLPNRVAAAQEGRKALLEFAAN